MKIDLYSGDECVERLWMEPGDEYAAEVYDDEFRIVIPDD